MPKSPDTSQNSLNSQSLLDQISEIRAEAEINKVQLTPEVQKYIRDHLEAVQQKLANREEVTVVDMQFMQDVRLWVSLPEGLRVKYRSIDEMYKAEEIRESSERRISLNQWLDLLHLAEAAEKDKKWIDETFRFPGGGRIETDIINLNTCTSLKSLPAGLEASRIMDLGGCTSLSTLPAGLKVKGVLVLEGCTSLISLPVDLEVGYNLYLPRNLHLQVIKDAERLKREGKIKGEIIYHNY